MILIVSHQADDHATSVLAELDRLAQPVVLIDTAQFPSNAFVIQRFEADRRGYEISIGERNVDLTSCHAGWWRRPQPFTLDSEISAEVVSFTYTECHEAIAGLWAALDIAWVNPPELDELAHHKPYQLAIASRIGLPIPRTLITNDPEAARRFINELGAERTVYKTFMATEQCWRETRIIRQEEMALLDRVRLAPVIFQEYIPAIVDIRVTLVGDKMFPAAISTARGGYDIDYRMDMGGASFEPTELPSGTEKRIRALMKRLGLVYGAVDLRRMPDGRHVFLEINPAGEWRFVEERTGQPITRAMAELLARLDRA